MDEKRVLYRSQTYDIGMSFFFAIPVFLIPSALVIIIGRNLHSVTFGVIGWIVVCSVPFLFQGRYKRLFTRRIELEFNKENFQIKEFKIKSNVIVKECTIEWAEIQSYKCSFSSSNVLYLVVYLWDGSAKGFSFKDGKDQEQAFKEKSVISIFYYFVMQYNQGKQLECEITLKPGFLMTKRGTLFLYGLSILTVISIVILSMIAPKVFLMPFMSFFIIMGLLLKRRTDKALYDKIRHLEPKLTID